MPEWRVRLEDGQEIKFVGDQAELDRHIQNKDNGCQWQSRVVIHTGGCGKEYQETYTSKIAEIIVDVP